MTLRELNEKLFSITDKYQQQGVLNEDIVEDLKDLFSSVVQYRSDKTYREELRKFFGGFDEESVKQKAYSKEYSKQSIEVQDKDSIFYGKSVVFTGDLSFISRESAAEYVHSKGASIKSAISSKTDIVIIGFNPGPAKLQKMEELIKSGVNIRKMDEEEFFDITGLK